MTQLYRILYCSRNAVAGTPEAIAHEVRDILACSRRNNARDGITGGLLFSEGVFAQVLEGPAAAVERAFERIQCDERHGEVTVLQASPIAARDFPDWSMAFAGADASASPLGAEAMAGAFSAQSGAGDQVLALLRSVVVRETEWLSPWPELERT